MLRGQADRGLTVLASVHQPAERLLARFDEVLMAAGGLLVYQGGNGKTAGALPSGYCMRNLLVANILLKKRRVCNAFELCVCVCDLRTPFPPQTPVALWCEALLPFWPPCYRRRGGTVFLAAPAAQGSQPT